MKTLLCIFSIISIMALKSNAGANDCPDFSQWDEVNKLRASLENPEHQPDIGKYIFSFQNGDGRKWYINEDKREELKFTKQKKLAKWIFIDLLKHTIADQGQGAPQVLRCFYKAKIRNPVEQTEREMDFYITTKIIPEDV